MLVKYSTALLAKGKGFNEICENWFVTDPDDDIEVMSNYDVSRGKWDEDYYRDLNLYAPVQSKVQKWLRDVHNIDIEIIPYCELDNTFDNYKEFYGYYCTITNKGLDLPINKTLEYKLFKIYEDCLENALVEALNLIK